MCVYFLSLSLSLTLARARTHTPLIKGNLHKDLHKIHISHFLQLGKVMLVIKCHFCRLYFWLVSKQDKLPPAVLTDFISF